ncbi:MAG: RidA family protein [Acidimicrobiaceae bacterium]|nr:RidA family protein [Acidimicrobiaceae bacterium]
MTARRSSLDIATLSHLAPIATATRIGPLVASSVVSPFQPGTRDVPESVADQVANLFIHVGGILAAAGASWDDVAKMTFFTHDVPSTVAELNPIWLEHFPDPRSRPSRHCIPVPDGGDGIAVVCDVLAYVEEAE